MSVDAPAYGGVGLSPRARRTLSSLVVVFALVVGVFGLAAPAHAYAVATVTGQLTGPGGAPAAGVTITISYPIAATTMTDANGRYSLSDSVPDDETYDSSICWGNQLGLPAGNPHVFADCGSVSVRGGTTTTYDHRVLIGGVLSGVVTGVGAGPLRGARVFAYRKSGTQFTQVANFRTDANGAYSGLVPAGTYRLEFGAADNRSFAGEFFEDAATLESAADLPIGSGDDVTADAELALAAGVVGQVTPSPFADVPSGRSVVLFDAAGAVVRRAEVHTDNRFSILRLAPGTYKLAFNRLSGFAVDAAQFYDGKAEPTGTAGATPITVTAGRQTAVSAQLQRGGSIAGRILGSGGDPLVGCRVQAYTRDGSLVTRLGLTDATGIFDIGGLATGSYYVRVLAPKGTTGDCDGERMWVHGSGGPLATAFTGATPVSVVQGQTKNLSPSLVYATGSRIAGTVALPSAHLTRRDRTVVARDTASGKVEGTALVDPGTGDYTVRGLTAGTYRVTFARVSGMATTEAEFYDDHPESAGPATADTVTLTDGQVRDGVDASLAVGRVLTGRIVNPNGGGRSRCLVQAFTSSGVRVTRATRTDRDGAFAIGGLTAGKYKLRVMGRGVRASDCRGATGLYDGTSTLRPEGPVDPPILVDQASVSLGDLTYTGERGGPTISGTVTFPAGSDRYSDRYLVVRNLADGSAHKVRVGLNGTWSLAGLDLGSYRVTYDRLSAYAWAAPQVHRGLPEGSVASATPVVLDAAHPSASLTATLTEGRHITGRLLDSEGQPLGCELQAFTGDRHLVTRRGFTDANGSFSIDGLSPGAYKIRVLPGYECVAGTQYLQSGSTTLSTAPTTFTVPTVPVASGATDLGTLTYTLDPPPSIVNRTAPTVGGTPQAGSPLTALEGTWRPGSVSFAYQWFSGASAISGAQGRTYVPGAAQVGRRLSVRVTASRPGYTSTSLTSAATSPVAAAAPAPPGTPAPAGPLAFALAKKPKISGKAVVGSKLKAAPGATTPAAATVSYQWLLNGKVIKRATKAKLKLVPAEAGKRISLRITFTSPGYTPLVVTSKAVRVRARPKGGG